MTFLKVFNLKQKKVKNGVFNNYLNFFATMLTKASFQSKALHILIHVLAVFLSEECLSRLTMYPFLPILSSTIRPFWNDVQVS